MVERLRELAASQPMVFSHNDIHPQNVLFDSDHVTGVIDCSGPRLAPRGLDVALCRVDLTIAPGGVAADAFLEAYRTRSGKP